MRIVLSKKETIKNSNIGGLSDSNDRLNCDGSSSALVTLLRKDESNNQTVESQGLSEN